MDIIYPIFLKTGKWNIYKPTLRKCGNNISQSYTQEISIGNVILYKWLVSMDFLIKSNCPPNNILKIFPKEKKSAALGIKWDTLRIVPSETWYSELSEITGGICLNFQNSAKISDVVIGTTYARGASYSDTASKAYGETCSYVADSGDSELIGAFKQISTLIDKK